MLALTSPWLEQLIPWTKQLIPRTVALIKWNGQRAASMRQVASSSVPRITATLPLALWLVQVATVALQVTRSLVRGTNCSVCGTR
jgi:hypothetical protein